MRRAAAAAALTLAACGHAPHHLARPAPAPLAADDGLRHALAAASRSRPPAPAPPAPAVRRAPTRRVPPSRGVGGRVPSGELTARTARVSWYGRGARTASGEAFNPGAMTFAARSHQWGRRIRFCHDGRCVVARQNDYGPAAWTGRDFDLSRGAFAAIAPLGAGVVSVTWEVVG